MKNRTKLLVALLGLSFTLTACSSAANTAQAAGSAKGTSSQRTVGSTNITASRGASGQQTPDSTNTAANPTGNYIQVFIDPNTGELVTIDPNTGEAIPYTAPAAASASQAAGGTVSGSQTTAQTKVSASQKTAATAGVQNGQAAAQSNQTGSVTQNQKAASADATTQATPTTTTINQASLPDRNVSMAQAANSSSYIGETKALEIAMNHAGINSANVQFSYAKLDFDDGLWIYDAEFYAGNTEYDYEIDASTGAVLSYDYDMESNYVPKQQAQTSAAASAGSAGVSIETAKQTALSRVSGATESNIRIYTDYDDGRTVYEGKIIYNTMEYEFEIDAATGNIIEWDAESIYD